MKKEYRYLKLRSDGKAQIRMASFRGKEHVVVPVVGLVEGVVRSANSKRPEFVPGDEIMASANSWNGRPVVPAHPRVNGEYVLANSPELLEKYQFGMLFNSVGEDNKLKFEAWLDADRASVVGPDAVSVIERARASQPIEISVGVMMHVEEKVGEYNGEKYEGIWHNLSSDHLAMLAEGVRGACSNDMGCGAPRFAEADPMADDKDKKTLRQRLLDIITFRSNKSEADMSDSDLRRGISEALRAVEPGYLGIDSVFPSEQLVVYATMPEQELLLFRREYSLNDDGSIKLEKAKEEVRPVTRYEPLSASAEPPCGCGTRHNEGEANMKTKAERVKALIENPAMKLAKDSQAALEASPDTVIDSLELAAGVLAAGGGTANPPGATPPATPPASVPAAGSNPPASTPPAAGSTPPAGAPPAGGEGTRHAEAPRVLSMEEYINQAPPDMREGLRAVAAETKTRKTAAIKMLTESGRCDYTEAELQVMEVGAVEKMAKLVGGKKTAVDYGPNGIRANTGTEGHEGVPAPVNLYKSIRVAEGVEKAETAAAK